MTNSSDVDDLSSAFAKLSNDEPKAEETAVPKKEQVPSKWNKQTRDAILNTHKITIPPPHRKMFYSNNINANVWQKRTIQRLYNVEREMRIELANPPDPKTLIPLSELGPKPDPPTAAKKAFDARYDVSSPEYAERRKKSLELKAKKSMEALDRRNSASRKAGHDV